MTRNPVFVVTGPSGHPAAVLLRSAGEVGGPGRLTRGAEEAETVRMIFRRYLELGSLGALVQDLDRSGFRTRRQAISNGRTRGGSSGSG